MKTSMILASVLAAMAAGLLHAGKIIDPAAAAMDSADVTRIPARMHEFVDAAGYVICSATWSSFYFPVSIQALQRALPSHTSHRDSIEETASALPGVASGSCCTTTWDRSTRTAGKKTGVPRDADVRRRFREPEISGSSNVPAKSGSRRKPAPTRRQLRSLGSER